MLRGGRAFFGTLASGQFLAPDGSSAAPSYSFTSQTNTGMSRPSTSTLTFTLNGTDYISLDTNQASSRVPYALGATAGAPDNFMVRAAANSLRYAASSSATTTSRTEFNAAYAAIADAVATATMTVTIPNAAHSASLLVRVTGSAGAGGAIGANEATATNTYVVSINRTAGVNAVATISAAFGAAASTVAGGNSVTCTAALSAIAGAVGASNTFTVNVTITRSASTATNHTCLVYAQLMNANVTGITLS